MDNKLFEILVCPLCKGGLQYSSQLKELTCRPCGLAYPIQDDIPVMLADEARTLTTDERLDSSSNKISSRE